MLRIHPKILKKNGQKQFVILPYEEFNALQEQLADAQDLRDLREARRADDPKARGLTLDEPKTRLGIPKRASRRDRKV